MKLLNRTNVCALLSIGALALTSSCKKEITSSITANGRSNSAATISATSCKPTVFGATITYPGTPARWVTFMQKWYGQDGKLAFLKAHFYTDMYNLSMLEHSIEWGVLSYHNNNQVYLKNGDDVMMRVTLDAQQRPAASYYHHDHFPKGSYLIDTSYYHYSGDRLDAVERLYVDSYGGRPDFEKFTYFYDGFGNLVRIDCWSPRFNTVSMFLSYDYGKPVSDMVTLPRVTIPFKLLEYMDLLRFPVHHQLTQVTGFGNNIQFNNYSLTGSGFVSSYAAAGGYLTFYTGWDCSGVATATSTANLNSVEDFRKMFPGQK